VGERTIIGCTVLSSGIWGDCGTNSNIREGDATKDLGVNEVLELFNCGMDMCPILLQQNKVPINLNCLIF